MLLMLRRYALTSDTDEGLPCWGWRSAFPGGLRGRGGHPRGGGTTGLRRIRCAAIADRAGPGVGFRCFSHCALLAAAFVLSPDDP